MIAGRRERVPALGYAMAAAGAALAGLNGSLGRYLLDDGLSSMRLTQMRSAIVVAVLGVVLTLWRPGLLRVQVRDLPWLTTMSVAGLAATQAAYFYAISRMQIGAALVIQYLYPLLLLVWLRAAHGRRLRRGLWTAVLVALVGSLLVVRAYEPGALDVLGVAGALTSAVAFCVYIVGSEQASRRYPAPTVLFWAFVLASVFWLVVQPPWSFPFHLLGTPDRMLLAVAIGTVGTLLPFGCIMVAVRHIPAPRAGVVLMLETVFGAAFAYMLHGEALTALQICGGSLVVGAITWLQLQRGSHEQELAPRARWEEPEAGRRTRYAALRRRG